MNKTLEFIYQENEIHFCINGNDNEVMINATEMAKVFGKRTDHFLQNESTKTFIEALKVPEMSGTLDDKKRINDMQIIENRGRSGIYFNRRLALKFAAWLDVKFEVWVYSKIDDLIFGNYKKHWEAHAKQEAAKLAMENLKTELLQNPTPDSVREYFEYEQELKQAKTAKSKAIRHQLKLFTEIGTKMGH